jgi:hypothetical protein
MCSVVEEIAFRDCSKEERQSVMVHRGTPLSHGRVDGIEDVERISAGSVEVWPVAGGRGRGRDCICRC